MNSKMFANFKIGSLIQKNMDKKVHKFQNCSKNSSNLHELQRNDHDFKKGLWISGNIQSKMYVNSKNVLYFRNSHKI